MIINEPVKPAYWFRHILYLSHHTSVCHQPELLDSDFVYVDFDAPGPGCKPCLDITAAHNLSATFHPIVRLPEETYSMPIENPLSFARGFMYAAAISLVFWITLIVMLRLGFR